MKPLPMKPAPSLFPDLITRTPPESAVILEDIETEREEKGNSNCEFRTANLDSQIGYRLIRNSQFSFPHGFSNSLSVWRVQADRRVQTASPVCRQIICRVLR